MYNLNDLGLLKAAETPGKFNNRWEGPFRITKILSKLAYEITRLNITSNRQLSKQTVHSNRLKLYFQRNENIFEPQNKVKVDSQPNENIEMQGPVKRKRGRPPKNPRPDQPPIIPLVKRGRGRPPKHNKPNDVQQTQSRVSFQAQQPVSVPYRAFFSHNNFPVTPSHKINVQVFNNQPPKHELPVPIHSHTYPKSETPPKRYNLRTVVNRPRRL